MSTPGNTEGKIPVHKVAIQRGTPSGQEIKKQQPPALFHSAEIEKHIKQAKVDYGINQAGQGKTDHLSQHLAHSSPVLVFNGGNPVVLFPGLAF